MTKKTLKSYILAWVRVGWVWFCYVYNLLCLGPKGPGFSNKEKPESWLGLEPKEMRGLLLADLLTVKMTLWGGTLSVKRPHLLFCFCPLLPTVLCYKLELSTLSPTSLCLFWAPATLQKAKHLKHNLGQGSNFLHVVSLNIMMSGVGYLNSHSLPPCEALWWGGP